ncbi:MAG: zinc-dependent metalloprotease [Actinomycetes bacterium]
MPERAVDRAVARANGAQLGGVLALLGTRILGQFLPFSAQPSLVLVAPNVARIERHMAVDHADFRLWVCLHEQTHRLQFARAPWLRAHFLGEVGRLLADTGDEPRRGRPRSLIEAVTTPAQQRVFERVGAVMSLLEGYADDMMDRVGPDVVPSVATIRRRFEKRRNRGGWTKVLNSALGMDLKLAQYRDGARFCRAVIGRVGVDGLNRVYEGPANLPTPDEIAHPAQWVRRVHG